jgi:hypothetical protein
MHVLKEILPRARHLAVMWTNASSTAAFERIVRGSLDRAAGNLGLSLRYHEIARPDDVERALATIASSDADAVWFQGSSVMRTARRGLHGVAKAEVAAIAQIPLFAEAGGLVHYRPTSRSLRAHDGLRRSHPERRRRGSRSTSRPSTSW